MMMHHEQSTRAQVDTSDARAHLDTAAALGFVIAATPQTTMPTVLQLLARLPLQHRTAREPFGLIGQAGPATQTFPTHRLRSELGPSVSLAFSVGYASHLAWKGGPKGWR